MGEKIQTYVIEPLIRSIDESTNLFAKSKFSKFMKYLGVFGLGVKFTENSANLGKGLEHLLNPNSNQLGLKIVEISSIFYTHKISPGLVQTVQETYSEIGPMISLIVTGIAIEQYQKYRDSKKHIL